MPNHQVSISDIILINKVIFPTSKLVVIYLANRTLDIDLSNASKVLVIKNKIGLKQFTATNKILFSLVNFSDISLLDLKNQSLFLGLLDFSNTTTAGYQTYSYLNNPDGSIRWFFPKANKKACFLALYNGSGWKARLFVTTSKLLNKIGRLSILTDGHFMVYYHQHDGFKTSFPEVPFDDFAVFTGTIGENRKAIIALSSGGKTTQFLKIPLTDAAIKLVKNEFCQLLHLESFVYHSTVLPEVKNHNHQIMVSNISPERKSEDQRWSTVHWQSLSELYRNTYQCKPLINTPFWKTIEAGIAFFGNPLLIKNGLSEEKITSLKNYTISLFNRIDPTNISALGMGHGDFTPWNMYVGQGRLHIYDWEMSQPDYPLLFDFFHYYFQKGILINRENFTDIQKKLQKQFQQKEAKQILATYRLDKQTYYRLYLLYIVCYYLPKYLVQPKLHTQVHWLVSTWLEALENIYNSSNNENPIPKLDTPLPVSTSN